MAMAFLSTSKIKYLLILESLFFGLSTSLTTGILFVYIASIGAGIKGISVVVGLAGITKLIVHLLLNKHPRFLVTKVRANFLLNYFLDRILLLFIPLTQNYLIIAIIYSMAAATPTTAFVNLAMFGSLDEKEVKDVAAKRNAGIGVSSIVGYSLVMLLLAFLPSETKFFYIYVLGVIMGMVCVYIISLMNLSHLEGAAIPEGIEKPEKLFSTSAYFMAVLAGWSLLTMVWVPYVMDYLKGPDYLAVAMYLIYMLTSVGASIFWKRFSLRTLRYNVGLDTVPPILALMTPIPIIQPLIASFSSFTYTGSFLIGNFLFANYKRWLGPIRSSILIVIVYCLAYIMVAPIGIFFKDNYFLLFAAVFGIKLISFILASFTMPEVAVISEEEAASHSYMLYNKSVMGYRVSIGLTRNAILLTLRLIGLSFVLLMFYVIYRILILLMH
jgi:hypothetical protein